MSDQWRRQLRIYLDDERATIARRDPQSETIKPITNILSKYNASLKNQLEAFQDYVTEAEKLGVDSYPLYKWTKITIEDPAKNAKHSKCFAIHVDGAVVYASDIANALEADLQSLVTKGLITGLSMHDTNPANNPQPPAKLVP
jgi:hypothetical protein